MLEYAEKKKFLFEIAKAVEKIKPFSTVKRIPDFEYSELFVSVEDLLFRKKNFGSYYEVSSKRSAEKIVLIRIHSKPSVERRSESTESWEGWELVSEKELEESYEKLYGNRIEGKDS